MEETSAILFMGCCMFLPMILLHFSMPSQIKTVYVYIEKPEKNIPTIIEKDKRNEKNNPLKADAINCLVSLGMKKSSAKIKVDAMFNEKEYNSIENFLIDAYKM